MRTIQFDSWEDAEGETLTNREAYSILADHGVTDSASLEEFERDALVQSDGNLANGYCAQQVLSWLGY